MEFRFSNFITVLVVNLALQSFVESLVSSEVNPKGFAQFGSVELVEDYQEKAQSMAQKLFGKNIEKIGDIQEFQNSGRADRTKRSPPISANLAELFRQAYKSPGLKGEVLYTMRKLCTLTFDFDYEAFAGNHVEVAELRLYKRQTSPKFMNKIFRAQEKEQKTSIPKARVSILQILKKNKKNKNRDSTRLLDSRLVSINEYGWIKFDISKALKDWIQNTENNLGLEVWIESGEPGKRAARIARKTKFVKPSHSNSRQHPSLSVFFK